MTTQTSVALTEIRCPDCLGTGTDLHSETGFYCLTCHGAGTFNDVSAPVKERAA